LLNLFEGEPLIFTIKKLAKLKLELIMVWMHVKWADGYHNSIWLILHSIIIIITTRKKNKKYKKKRDFNFGNFV